MEEKIRTEYEKEIDTEFDRKVYLVDKESSEDNKKQEARIILGQCYEDIIEILKDYSDLKERDYQIISLWIIGTYFYKEFLTFPFLFLNAMKGSGKSRTLRLITTLSWNGQQLGSMTEASLFRTAGKGTMGLDEFEKIAKKENAGLREVLNAGYKKGMKIIRMKKKKTLDGEEQVPEYFEPYTPIVMANIWGQEEVLGDRCITAILEKSSKCQYTKKVEDFEHDLKIQDVKIRLKVLANNNLVSLCRYLGEKNIYIEWNKWVNMKYRDTTTLTTLTTLTTHTTPNLKLDEFFIKLDNADINGRDLELYLSLFIIAKVIGDDVFEKILTIAKDTTKEKRQDEMMESSDVQLFEFVANKEPGYFYTIKELTDSFKLFTDYDEKDEYSNWLNIKWMGRALKRLGLVVNKRRMAFARQVSLNTVLAQEKIKMFK